MKTYRCLNCNSENQFRYSYSNKYCNNKCQATHRSQLHKRNWYAGLLEKKIDRPTIRRYLAEDRGYVCELCKISEWNNKSLVLQVDHIDGNAGDDSPDNVRLLCPNCHSQTDCFSGANKGNGRAARGLSLR